MLNVATVQSKRQITARISNLAFHTYHAVRVKQQVIQSLVELLNW